MTAPILDTPAGTQEDYRVRLDCYQGPLDLLLFLVKRHEIDLNDIPIARLTEQYLDHLKLIQQIDVNLAGEFLVMAATLLEIKSQMLIPRDSQVQGQADDGGDATDAIDVMDPRYELVQQLLAYKRFKDAASDLEDRFEDWQARFAVQPKKAAVSADDEADDAEPIEIDLDEVNVLDLCEAFARILDSIGQAAGHQVTYDDTPISLHAEDIIDRLRRDGIDGAMSLQKMFEGRRNRSEMIGLFLATLELVRQRKLIVQQDKARGEIQLVLVPEEQQSIIAEEDKPADWRDPQTGEMQYEWPSEDARRRAERRSRLRAERIARGRFAKPGEGDPAAEAGEDDIIDVDED